MSIGRTLVGIVVLATSGVVFAQIAQTKPPDVGSSGATNNQSSATPAPNPCQSEAKALPDKRTPMTAGSAIEQALRAAAANRGRYGGREGGDYGLSQGRNGAKTPGQAEILTDTMGVDFGPYLACVVDIVRNNWYHVMPESVYPPILKQGRVSIEFFILKDGNVSGMQVHFPSGDVELDRAAGASITASNPFPPLPREFPGQNLGLRFYFFYNLQPNDIGFSISPSADVRVPAGSTLQFSASGKGITHGSVTWSVSGLGCSKSACGTISDTGLYTAPIDIPNPPTVIVEATSRTDTSITGRSKVTVVQANPSNPSH